MRKAGALAVKNFLVHKKNKKVELATRRKWKHYWVSLKGVCEIHAWFLIVCIFAMQQNCISAIRIKYSLS